MSTIDLHKPGTVVVFRNDKNPLDQHNEKRFRVLDPGASQDWNVRNDSRRTKRNLVRGEDGLRWWFLPEMLHPVVEPEPEPDTVTIARDDLDVLLNVVGPKRTEVATRLRSVLAPPRVTTYTVTVTQPAGYTEPYPADRMRQAIEHQSAEDLTIEVEMN